MVTKTLSDGLEQYAFWIKHTRQTIDEIQNWLEKNDLFSEDAWTILARCLNKLDTDGITIAFVGEFSRGKTELINSLFFSKSGKRLLPSDAGRTTMCPTEILYDHQQDEAYIRLLPIETRLRDETLTTLRKNTEEWVEFPLDLQNSEALSQTLKELASTQHVRPEEASRYGLLHEHFTQNHQRQPKYVDIPKWRHAIISYPHPLLKQGLKILDTPGLNAIGSEAELTLTMLPSAQAAVFVLAADTGVTQSDLDIWQNHLNGHHKNRRKGLTVVLNKIDTLWDELRSEEDISETIKSQILYTARILGVSLKQIFPVSAQKSLIALVREDKSLLHRSGMIELEDHLNHEVTQVKQDIIKDDINAEITDLLKSLKEIIHHRITNQEQQHQEMDHIFQQSDVAIDQLLNKTQKEQDTYRYNATAFNQCEAALNEKAQNIQTLLAPQVFDQLLQQTKFSMESSWTTNGIAKAVESFIDQLVRIMEELNQYIEEDQQLIKSIYQRFQEDHGIGVIQPKTYSLKTSKQNFEHIIREAHAFAQGYRIALLGHSAIVDRFFTTIATQMSELLIQIRKDIHHWTKHSLQPLSFQITDHQEMLNRHIQDLKLATSSKETVEKRLSELNQSIEDQNNQLKQLDAFIKALTFLPHTPTSSKFSLDQ